MNEMNIASTATTDRLDKVYVLLNSLKQNKRKDTRINYHLFLQFTEKYDKKYCNEYFASLYDTDFTLVLEDTAVFKKDIVTPGHSYVYYIRYLFPSYFNDLDKILYLDVDAVVVRNGIEDFWNTDVTDYYVGAVLDPTWQYCYEYRTQVAICGIKNYFNDGIILMNLSKIREDKKDIELKKWCLSWDETKAPRICYAQTLGNYVLKDKVKLISSKYNNSVMASLPVAVDWYNVCAMKEGYMKAIDSILDAVILHFCGANKPWGNSINKKESEYPYKEIAVPIWNDLYKKYKK